MSKKDAEPSVRFSPIDPCNCNQLWDELDESELGLLRKKMVRDAEITMPILEVNSARDEQAESTHSPRERENFQRHIPGRLRKRPIGDPKLGQPPERRRVVSSRNWSGAVVPALCGRRFTRVAAEWEIPKLAKGPNEDHRGSMISIWVGLGGWDSWSNSMPHMGTEHGWGDDGITPIHRVWCQWWLGKDRNGWLSRIMKNVEIASGDKVICYLAATDDIAEFYVSITKPNTKQKQLAGVRAEASRAIIGSSAEWVVERPMRIERHGENGLPRPVGLHPVPPIHGDGRVIMRNCIARLGPIDDSRLRALEQADLITLIGRQRDGLQQQLRLQQELRPQVYKGRAGKDELWVSVTRS